MTEFESQIIPQQMEVDQPILRNRDATHRTYVRNTKTRTVPINPEIIQNRVIDPTFDKANPKRWNRNFMTSLNNNRVSFNQKMLNPVAAQQYVSKRPGWEIIDNEDLDLDGQDDLAVYNRNGELVWFNGYKRTPAQNHTYNAKDYFVQNPGTAERPNRRANPNINQLLNQIAQEVIKASPVLKQYRSQVGSTITPLITRSLRPYLIGGLINNDQLRSEFNTPAHTTTRSAWNALMRSKTDNSRDSILSFLYKILNNQQAINTIASAYSIVNGQIQVNPQPFLQILQLAQTEAATLTQELTNHYNAIIQKQK